MRLTRLCHRAAYVLNPETDWGADRPAASIAGQPAADLCKATYIHRHFSLYGFIQLPLWLARDAVVRCSLCACVRIIFPA